jgi:hypothetical protein
VRRAALVLLLLSPATAALTDAGWPGFVVALVAVAAVVLTDLEGSEVVHVVVVLEAVALALAGSVLAGLGALGELPAWAKVTLFLVPAAACHQVARRRRREPLTAEEAARLAAAPLAEVVAAAGTSRTPGAVAALIRARPGGIEALFVAARAGTPAERLGAAEAAVALRSDSRSLALELAREVLLSAASGRDAQARALVAIRDGADVALLEVLRGLGADDPPLRAAALEVRARSGDPRALDDWLADAALDAEATAPGLVLALGPRARLAPRLAALRASTAEGSVARARVEALLRAAEVTA